MILILERQSRNGVATIAIFLTQISHRVMVWKWKRIPIKSMEDKYTQSAIESRAIDKAIWQNEWCEKRCATDRVEQNKRHLLETSTFEKVM
ncbi:MAG: hypothetical protein II990_03760 [Muribaculaceae bacterium]|nr:hypothetical protein [Muribaculaceae bacterium]